MIGIESVTPNIPNLRFEADKQGERYWSTEQSELLTLFHFSLPPDLPAPPRQIDTIRRFYRRGVTEAGMAIVSVDSIEIDGCAAVKTIFKGKMSGEGVGGVVYVGSITVPFRDFSFVLQTVCREQGITGVRDSVVAARLTKQGKIAGPDRDSIGWFADPYDSEFHADFLRNRSDDEEYDSMFPNHPLSRVRNLLRMLEERATISSEAKSAASFTG